MKIREAYIAYKETGETVRTQALTGPSALAAYMRDAIDSRPDQEQFWVILLDAKLHPIARSCLFLGTLDAITIHPREVFRTAILAAAQSIIVVHNHPSGDPMPSGQDVAVTSLIEEAGALVGMPMPDHVIVSVDWSGAVRHYSFRHS